MTYFDSVHFSLKCLRAFGCFPFKFNQKYSRSKSFVLNFVGIVMLVVMNSYNIIWMGYYFFKTSPKYQWKTNLERTMDAFTFAIWLIQIHVCVVNAFLKSKDLRKVLIAIKKIVPENHSSGLENEHFIATVLIIVVLSYHYYLNMSGEFKVLAVLNTIITYVFFHIAFCLLQNIGICLDRIFHVAAPSFLLANPKTLNRDSERIQQYLMKIQLILESTFAYVKWPFIAFGIENFMYIVQVVGVNQRGLASLVVDLICCIATLSQIFIFSNIVHRKQVQILQHLRREKLKRKSINIRRKIEELRTELQELPRLNILGLFTLGLHCVFPALSTIATFAFVAVQYNTS